MDGVLRNCPALRDLRGAVLALALVLAGCAGVTPSKSVPSAPTAATAATTAGKPKAPGVHPVEIAANCAWRDETGYNGRMALQVTDSEVQTFAATVNHPKHGTCQFALQDFRQTLSQPQVELSARQGACKVHMWTQGRQVTVGFQACRSMCSGDAIDYLWPILADAKAGTCG